MNYIFRYSRSFHDLSFHLKWGKLDLAFPPGCLRYGQEQDALPIEDSEEDSTQRVKGSKKSLRVFIFDPLC
jgi:hypothetical protein